MPAVRQRRLFAEVPAVSHIHKPPFVLWLRNSVRLEPFKLYLNNGKKRVRKPGRKHTVEKLF